MTIIAYRNGVMAADTLVSDPETHSQLYYAKKIFKTEDGCLVGANGDCKYCLEFIEWAQGSRALKPPKQGSGDGAILVMPDGEIRMFSGQHYEVPLDDFVTIGSGSSWATGAFEMNATAEQAVEVAKKWCMTCKGITHIEKLDSIC